MAKPTTAELTAILRNVAEAQAKLYYKPLEPEPPVIVVRAVFMLIVAAVTIAFSRAGLSDTEINDLEGIPDEIGTVMQIVGWKLDNIVPW